MALGISPHIDADSNCTRYRSQQPRNRPLITTEDVSLIMFWSILEGGTAVVAACLPTMKSILKDLSSQSLLRNIRSTLSLPWNLTRGVWASIANPNGNRLDEGSSVEQVFHKQGGSLAGSLTMRDLEAA